MGELSGGPIGVAVRAQYGKERNLDDLNDFTNAGDLDFGLAATDFDGVRGTKAAFAEVALPFLESFELNRAARYEKLSNWKGTTNPRASVLWKANDKVSCLPRLVPRSVRLAYCSSPEFQGCSMWRDR